MLFSEPSFLFYFLPAVLLLHTLAPRSLRNPLLLIASLLFYAWGEPVYVLLLLVSVLANALSGLGIASRRRALSRASLAAGIAANLLLLGHFKYIGFLAETLGFHFAGPPLPIGISFFTFQALSYLIDVHRGQASVQRNPLTLALYISMFPQLIAGPIVRYHDIDAQLSERRVRMDLFATGVRRFAVGLAKKMLIANTLALPADRIFDLPASELTLGLSWLAVVCYTLQIYFDFSGYSDMAIGLGRMFGFRYLENFDHPYVSRSIREFWRRWHISLSSWFRDYLYIPLGGSRGPGWRTALNLWTVFLLCGLWHGASWNFVLWGAFHGFFLALERSGSWTRRLPAFAAHTYTLLVVMLGWVFFRAETLPAALGMLRGLVGLGAGGGVVHNVALETNAAVWLALAAGIVGATPLTRDGLARLAAGARRSPPLEALAAAAQVVGAALLLLGCFAVVAADTYNPFIYFRF